MPFRRKASEISVASSFVGYRENEVFDVKLSMTHGKGHEYFLNLSKSTEKQTNELTMSYYIHAIIKVT